MEAVTAVQVVRLGLMLEWSRAEVIADLTSNYGMSESDANALYDNECRDAQEREIIDSHDELLDAEARRQEHGAL